MSYLADQHHSHRTEQASHTAVCHSDSTWLPPGTLLTITIILRSVNSIVCDEMIIHLSARCISAVRLSVCLSVVMCCRSSVNYVVCAMTPSQQAHLLVCSRLCITGLPTSLQDLPA